MIILVINCGSSSIKYQLLDMKSDEVYDLLAKGIVEKIGLETGRLQHTVIGKDKVVKDLPVPDHKVGMKLVLEALTDSEHGVLKSLDDIEAVGHLVSGLWQLTLYALLTLAFAAPPVLKYLKLASYHNSPDRSTKSTPSPVNGL